jgi:hypothetical protein
MAATELSPNADNLYLGAGIVKWKGINDADYRDVGECPKFDVTMAATRLPYLSSRVGVRRRIKNAITQAECNIAMTLSEVTAQTMALYLLGTDTEGSGTAGTGSPSSINIGDTPDIEGALRFVGTNVYGAMVQVDLPDVSISPQAALALINNAAWGEIQLMADANYNETNGNFGRVLWGITTEQPYP